MFNIPIELVHVQKIVRDVLSDHGTDPFPCMHGAEEDDGGIDARAWFSIEMDALDIPLLKRFPGCEDS